MFHSLPQVSHQFLPCFLGYLQYHNHLRITKFNDFRRTKNLIRVAYTTSLKVENLGTTTPIQKTILTNRLRSSPLTTPPLHRQNLVIKRSQIHPQRGPSLKMILYRHCPTFPRGRSHRDVLVKSRGSYNGRFIHTLIFPNGIA